MEPLQVVKGMHDILPPESAKWEWLEDKLRKLMQRYAYRNIRTPIVEFTPLFVRGLGEVTDVVEKEMYTFLSSPASKNYLSLRPENTAGVVRALSANNSAFLRDGPKRLYYMGPMFRHENVQNNRQRQFHQFGAEAIGFAGPEVDVELILMACAFWRELGITEHVRLEINTLGQPEERKKHREALIAYFEAHQEQLDEDSQRRLHSNPLRILDTKNANMQALVNNAPKLIDYLGEESANCFERVKALLDANGVKWTFNPRLVRGLDYYNLTVFEFVAPALETQGTICGGGRYDYLFEMIGGRPAPAVGWAMGAERVLNLLEKLAVQSPESAPDVYAIIPDPQALETILPVLEQLRGQGINVQMHALVATGWGSMKSQFKKADASGAYYALIFGEDEMAQGQVTIKPLRDGTGSQWTRELCATQEWYQELLQQKGLNAG